MRKASPYSTIFEIIDGRRAELKAAVGVRQIDALAAFRALDGLVEDAAKMGRVLAMLLREVHGWTWQDIADLLGVSRQAAWERYHEVPEDDSARPQTRSNDDEPTAE